MYYCDRCRTVTETEPCPVCGKQVLSEANADTICFLVEKEMLWGEMFAGILKGNGIPFWYDTVLGAGTAIKIGPYREHYRFYVPFSFWEQANLLVEQVFTEEACT